MHQSSEDCEVMWLQQRLKVGEHITGASGAFKRLIVGLSSSLPLPWIIHEWKLSSIRRKTNK